MAAIEVEFRQIQFALDADDTRIEEALEAPVLAPFPEMIVRNLV